MLLHDNSYFFHKSELTALARVAYVQEDRDALRNVWFDRDEKADVGNHGGRAWATDGHQAVIVDVDGKSTTREPRGIRAAGLLDVAKLARARDLIAVRPGFANGKPAHDPTWSIYSGAGFKGDALMEAVLKNRIKSRDSAASGRLGLCDVSPPQIDAVFPGWEKSMPKSDGRTAFNPGLFAPFLAASSKVRGNSGQPVRFYLAGELDPILVVFRDHERETMWRYVIMPMRT